MNQTIDNRTSGTVWSTKALGACLMVVAALLAACLMAAQPAHAATTLTVNSTGDFHDTITNDGFCGFGGSCSLRAAIEEANSNPTFTEIDFDIPGTGVKTIVVNATGLGALPAITTQVTIDGYTQTGAHPNTLAVGNDAALKIDLDGTNVPGGNGLEISNSSGSEIKGLVINRFGLAGIAVGGDSGVNSIEGNFIGTNPSGTLDGGNGTDAVRIFDGASRNVVGGSTRAARNVLSGNGGNGVFVANSNANSIQGNYVGTDKSGTKSIENDGLGGVFLNNADDTTVGGTTAASRNVVSGNDGDGIDLDSGSTGNEVLGNRVGTTANGTGALGNGFDGVFVFGSNNLLGNGTSGGSNTIAFNGNNGVDISGSASTGNAISRNSVFSNAGIGIDLRGGVEDAAGRTANDAGDVDSGPNGLQNKPVLSSAKTVSGKTTIKGTLKSPPFVGLSYTIEFYSNPSGDEGKKFIGQKSVTTDSSGNTPFTFTPASAVAVGQTITATATVLRGSETSEFSAARKVASS